ncbi:hypothetical protein HRbin16_02105 [bacterium HR16]|nr:hypothetical protein HRbin16_02105 [bacterium HR16]
MELVEHGMAPRGVQLFGRISLSGDALCQQSADFRLDERILAAPVGVLDVALRRVTALKDKVQLTVYYGQVFRFAFGDAEELVVGAELDFGENGPFHHLVRQLQVASGGTTAVVAHAVYKQHVLQAGRLLELHHMPCDMGGDGSQIPFAMVVKRQHARAIPPLPPEQERSLSRATEVVVPDACPGEDTRHGVRMSEGVGFIIQAHRVVGQSELLLEEPPGVQQVTTQDFPRSHVFIALYPLASGHFPPAGAYMLFHLLPQLGQIVFHQLVGRRLVLREVKLRELAHQPIHRGEGIVSGSNRFRPIPHPVHIDMRVPDAMDSILLGDGRDGTENRFRLLHRVRNRLPFRHRLHEALRRAQYQLLPLRLFRRVGLRELFGKTYLRLKPLHPPACFFVGVTQRLPCRIELLLKCHLPPPQ